MKNKLLYLLAVALMVVTACSSETYHNSAETLPLEAQQYLSDYFESAVSAVKVEKNVIGNVDEYEVTLADGTEITFNAEGMAEETEAAHGTTLPDGVIPAEIKTYLAEHQKGAGVVKIERHRSGYELDLSNGLEVKFDRNGQFTGFGD